MPQWLEFGRDVKGFNRLLFPSEERRLRRTPRAYLEMDETQPLGQRHTVTGRTAATIVTQDERHAATSKVAKAFDEPCRVQAGDVTAIARSLVPWYGG
jgi:hypothetical protein